jgi:site-specific DNA-methyltransferase (adenine-specific)
LLWYIKGNKLKFSTDNISDVITSSEPDKALYKYQQSVEDASYIIKHLTVENAVIADFCMGSATTGIAALANKRAFIGCESDKHVYKIAEKRISQYLNLT